MFEKIYKNLILGTQIGSDIDVSFANSDPVNTQKNVDITKPTEPVSEYMLTVYNPSTVTDLTIKVFAKALSLKGSTRYSLIDTISIPKSQSITGTAIDTYSRYIHGIFNGSDVRLVVSNDTVLGGSDAFITTIRLREVM